MEVKYITRQNQDFLSFIPHKTLLKSMTEQFTLAGLCLLRKYFLHPSVESFSFPKKIEAKRKSIFHTLGLSIDLCLTTMNPLILWLAVNTRGFVIADFIFF